MRNHRVNNEAFFAGFDGNLRTRSPHSKKAEGMAHISLSQNFSDTAEILGIANYLIGESDLSKSEKKMAYRAVSDGERLHEWLKDNGLIDKSDDSCEDMPFDWVYMQDLAKIADHIYDKCDKLPAKVRGHIRSRIDFYLKKRGAL